MRSTDRPLLGIAYINFSFVLGSCNEALLRYLTFDYSPIQISFMRFLVMAVVAGAAILVLRRTHLFRSERFGVLIVIGVLAAVAILSLVFSLEYMSLDDTKTITFTMPLFVAMLSGWFLGERVSPARWLAIVVGFVGVAFALRPGAGMFDVGGIFALVSAATYAVRMLVYRKVTLTEDSLTILFYMSLVATLVHVPLVPFAWTPIWTSELPLLLLAGANACLLQYLMVQAYRYAVATTIAAFEYLAIIYTAIISYIVFAEIPTWHLAVAAALLAGGGLFIVWDEARRQRKEVAEPGD